MISNWFRRSHLSEFGTVALVGLIGCSETLAISRGAANILLHNESTNTLSIDVDVKEAVWL